MSFLSRIVIFVGTFLVSNNSFASYNLEINKCELLIAQENYTAALRNYVILFKSAGKVFMIDIHNALICAVLTKSDKEIKSLSKLLSIKGIPAKYFLERSSFSSLKNKKFWQKTALASQKNYEANLIKYQKYNQVLDSVLKYDQDTSVSLRDWNDDSVMYKKYRGLIIKNALFLCNYIDSTHFPDERTSIDSYLYNDTSFTYFPHFGAIIVHSYQSRRNINTDTFFSPVLRKALFYNQIKPQTLAYMQDMGNVNIRFRPYFGTTRMFTIYNDELYAQEYYFANEETREKIDSYRSVIELMPLSDAKDVVRYFYKKGRNLGFYLDARITSYSNSNSVPDGYIKLEIQ